MRKELAFLKADVDLLFFSPRGSELAFSKNARNFKILDLRTRFEPVGFRFGSSWWSTKSSLLVLPDVLLDNSERSKEEGGVESFELQLLLLRWS